MPAVIREVNNSISLEWSWKENNYIWRCGKSRAQVSAVSGGLLINSQQAIQHLWKCTGMPGWKGCSQGTHMRPYNMEDIQRRGKDKSIKPFSCPFLVSSDTTGRSQIATCYGLAAAGNKRTTWPPLPTLGCRGEWKETGRNWWVGIRAV